MAGTSTYVVERQQHIDAPPDEVRARIVDFHRWPAWSPWEELDPDMTRTYRGEDAGVGAVYEWDGNRRAGRGSMEIVDVDEREVVIDLHFLRPFRSHSTTTFVLEPDDRGTTVTWRMVGPRTLMTRVMGLFTSMDRMIGPDFEKGLDGLRSDTEGR